MAALELLSGASPPSSPRWKMLFVLGSIFDEGGREEEGERERERERERAREREMELEQMEVDVVEKGLVSPAAETPDDVIWLSNLELVQVGNITPTVMVYRKGRDVNRDDFFAVEKIKSAMSAALVHFYPLAGRLAVGPDGRHEIRCTGEGVYYVVARCSSTIDEVDFTPSPRLRQLLVPSAKSGHPRGVVFMFQLTFFKCGGACIGTWMEHCAADGLSALMFIKTWANIARGVESDVQAFYDHTPLRARSPPVVTYEHLEYQMSKPRDHLDESSAPAVVKLKISKDELASLKDKGRRDGAIAGYVTTFEAVMAHVWRCACKARQLEGHERTRVYMAADARSRLSPRLPGGYFGSAIVKTSAAATVDEIVSGSTRLAAERLREASARVGDEYVRSVVDYLETVDEDTGSLSLGSVAIPETDLWVVSWLKLPVYEADFGWGKVALMGRAQMTMNGLVYIMFDPEEAGGGGITVVVTLETRNMARFKKIFHVELEA